MDLDSAETTGLRRRIIRDKPLLRGIYRRWYRLLLGAVPAAGSGGVSGPGRVLELGSGAGFLSELAPHVLTSDIMSVDGVDAILDAHRLPVADGQLDAVLMVNVLHHLADPVVFFREAARAVRPGGVVAMIEPWSTVWSRWVYRNLHHEPFDPHAGWKLPGHGPLSDANGAIPWILTVRDRCRFEKLLPQWALERRQPLMPIAYLASGGVSKRSLCPGPLRWGGWAIDRLLGGPRGTWNAMFVHLVFRRTQAEHGSSGRAIKRG